MVWKLQSGTLRLVCVAHFRFLAADDLPWHLQIILAVQAAIYYSAVSPQFLA